MRPVSFAAEFSGQWSRWVLVHGLPVLPARVSVGESVPVAYWIGPLYAAVLHVRKVRWERQDEVAAETDVECFCLVDSNWQDYGGGGSGSRTDSLSRIEVAADHVSLDGLASGYARGRGCTALYGEVGNAAAYVEVIQSGATTRRVIDSPIGAVVVCGDSDEPFTVRVHTAHGELLHEVEQLPHQVTDA